MHHLDANKTNGEKAKWKLHKNAAHCFEPIQLATPNKTATVQPLTSHFTNNLSKTSKICRRALLEKQGWSHQLCSLINITGDFLHMDEPLLANQHELTYTSSVDTGCSIEDLQGAIDDRDRWLVRIRELYYQDDLMIMMMTYSYFCLYSFNGEFVNKWYLIISVLIA